MLSPTKLSLLQQLVQNASAQEIIWTKGYLAGYLDKNDITTNPIIQEQEPTVAVKPLILYATETGNSKKAATQLLANFKKNKIQAKAVDISQYDATKITNQSVLLFIVSTQGEGEFPQTAIPFYENLKNNNPDLSSVSFAVFGLGDSSYPLFCNAGVLLDQVLIQNQAKQLLPLVKADVDFSNNLLDWQNQLQQLFTNPTALTTVVPTNLNATTAAIQKVNYTGQIAHKVVLNDIGSNKQTFHIEIATDQPVAYQPGDALGIVPKNQSSAVQTILDFFAVLPSTAITIKNKTQTAYNWLENSNINGLSPKVLTQIATLFALDLPLQKTDLLDILPNIKNTQSVTLPDLLTVLLPIAPRLYSISSAPEAHDTEVHLTVNLNTFTSNNQNKTGFASGFLADYPLHTPIEYYIHKNNNFRLPTDTDTDIIMIGPGTGIAPFRSFLAQRDATGAEGKNWLFFGEQHFVLDFYYQTEIQDWLNTGVLTKLDTAFSRDQEQKIYVQDRILEKAIDFNNWLENGATIYVCGQKNPMSTDVQQAIIQVIAQQRQLTLAQATQILEDLETQGRYQKDVY